MRLNSFGGICLAAASFATIQAQLRSYGDSEVSHLSTRQVAEGKKGFFSFSRLCPGSTALFIANSDGTNPRRLLGLEKNSIYSYNPSFSPDGKYITFTSEHDGLGNSNLYRVKADGSDMEPLLTTPSMEDQGVLSPDNSMLAYVSTAEGYKANIWIRHIATGKSICLTNTDKVKGVSSSPDGYFRPQWSPNGKWIMFTSDRNTKWTGHANGKGWEHTQELSIYAIRPDGSDFKKVLTQPGFSLGSPKFSQDGRRIVFYNMTLEATYDVRSQGGWRTASSQIYTADFPTGENLKQETHGDMIKLAPSFVGDTIGYIVRGDKANIYYTDSSKKFEQIPKDEFGFNHGPDTPSWSPDGKQVVFEMWDADPGFHTVGLYSWDPDWQYRTGQQFEVLSKQGLIAYPDWNRQSMMVANANGSGTGSYFSTDYIRKNDPKVGDNPLMLLAPSWSPDGKSVAFCVGGFFRPAREDFTAWIYRIKLEPPDYPIEKLTDGTVNSGFPSYSADGKSLVYRVWGKEYGLRLMDLETKKITVLTTHTLNDNNPQFSPDGKLIVFTRRMTETNFDICTIRPDGSDLKVLTSSGANDGHAAWTDDGRIMWSSGEHGWKDEAPAYRYAEQPYGQLYIMDADGSNRRPLTDSRWEEAMPLYMPNEILR